MEIIKDYKYGYKVSNYGYLISPNGVNLKADKQGQVTIYDDGMRLNRRVSRIVAEVFIGDLTDNQIIRYIDEDCTNCHVDNLQIWRKDYYQSYFSTSKRYAKRGVDLDTAKLIKEVYEGNDITIPNLAKITRISQSTIWRIVNDKYKSTEKMSVV